jgi:hypothetical protein
VGGEVTRLCPDRRERRRWSLLTSTPTARLGAAQVGAEVTRLWLNGAGAEEQESPDVDSYRQNRGGALACHPVEAGIKSPVLNATVALSLRGFGQAGRVGSASTL